MIKHLVALTVAVTLSACSSSGSDDGGATTGTSPTNGTTTNGTTTNGTTGGGVTNGGPIAPTGSIAGAWFGNNHYGEGVMIVDAAGNVSALATNGAGQYESAFGPANGNLQRFVHRDSDNPAFADSFTLSGEPPSLLTGDVADDTIAYNLSTPDEGQSITNSGNFSMTFATENDLAPVSLASIAGNWTAKTSFCVSPPAAEECNLTLNMTFGADGTVTGSTVYNVDGVSPLNGTVTVAEGATQYLNISFTWTEKQRTGVVHVDRLDPTRLVINTFGSADTEGQSRSFTASMIRM